MLVSDRTGSSLESLFWKKKMTDPRVQLQVHPHHEQRKICASRAKYRDGRKPRAVKVYTINLESRYLLVQGVPAIGVMKELIEQFALFGVIEEYNPLDEYPAEQFTEVYLIKFQRLQSARIAKQRLDEISFFGGIIHVCYAPEFEGVQETREKLQDRRRYVARATNDRDYQGTEKRKHIETSGSVSTSVGSRFLHASPWGPAPKPDDFSPPQPYMMPEPYQDYRSTLGPENMSPGGAVHPPPCSRVSKTSNPAQELVSSGSAARFMPRTTQLQERQRRRAAGLAQCLSLSDSPETVIGPKLPELPKLDLEDYSLNASAKLISDKLKEVSGCSTATKPEATTGDDQPAPPVKQRRRI
ncbi:RNA-binding protein 48 isoform 1-T2 [Anomaloglossus baeobatrachus]|uniref:RNA-binding protein 48 n=1 Tax=Anomaloglossus baeobatrachus TaxID=238106 RepID=UPI003F4F7959